MSQNARTSRSRSYRWAWWLGALVFVLALIAWAATRPPLVSVAAAARGDLLVTVTATADVEGRVAEVTSALQGEVEAVYRDEGDYVRRGDLLCRVTAPPTGMALSDDLSAWESVTAPFDGVVSRRYVDPGDPAIPGQPLFQVADTSDLHVVALIDDIDVGKIHEGQAARIILPSYLGQSLAGRITRIGATATPRTRMGTGGRVVRTRIELTEDPGPLRPGMEVDVTAEAVVARNVLLIPADAIIEDETGRYVFRLEGDRVRRTEVEIGANNYMRAEVRSGLNAGDRVVVDGKDTLADGDRVRTTEWTGGA